MDGTEIRIRNYGQYNKNTTMPMKRVLVSVVSDKTIHSAFIQNLFIFNFSLRESDLNNGQTIVNELNSKCLMLKKKPREKHGI